MTFVPDTPISGGINADAPFWEYLADGELRLSRCVDCRRWMWPAHYRCGACGSWDIGWDQLEPVGSVYSWTRTWYPFDRTQGRAEDLPFVVVLAEVDGSDGARVLGVLGGDESSLAVGARLHGEIQPPSAKSLGYPSIVWTLD